MADVGFAFGLEPEKAIAFLKSKKAIIGKLEGKGISESALAKATTIANLTSLEMTKDIYQSLMDAQAKGQSFEAWKADIFEHFKKKGWIAGYDKGYLLGDPKTGEFFGTPRRLDTIYRTNMQQAYSAQRYQQLRDNVHSRPYWQYSAVNDNRTRPSHGAMHGLIYRYDDPFWSVFYPPNGFNCRCSVVALGDRDIERRGLVVGNAEERLVEYERSVNTTTKEKTVAFKLTDNKWIITDRGFDYNSGKMTYRPNLDKYPEALAHQFAKREMSGGEFKFGYGLLEKTFEETKAKLGFEKITSKELHHIEALMTKNFKFTAGILSKGVKRQIQAKGKTVWLSDATLIKQFDSRAGEKFGFEEYSVLPDLLNQPDKVIVGKKKDHFEFYKMINGKRYVAVIKKLAEEIFMQSFRIGDEKAWYKLFKND